MSSPLSGSVTTVSHSFAPASTIVSIRGQADVETRGAAPLGTDLPGRAGPVAGGSGGTVAQARAEKGGAETWQRPVLRARQDRSVSHRDVALADDR